MKPWRVELGGLHELSLVVKSPKCPQPAMEQAALSRHTTLSHWFALNSHTWLCARVARETSERCLPHKKLAQRSSHGTATIRDV